MRAGRGGMHPCSLSQASAKSCSRATGASAPQSNHGSALGTCDRDTGLASPSLPDAPQRDTGSQCSLGGCPAGRARGLHPQFCRRRDCDGGITLQAAPRAIQAQTNSLSGYASCRLSQREQNAKTPAEAQQTRETPMNTSTRIQSQLLATKFYVPTASGTLISRPRLNALLDKGLTHPFTLVSAPAGFGKTTLLSTWAH